MMELEKIEVWFALISAAILWIILVVIWVKEARKRVKVARAERALRLAYNRPYTLQETDPRLGKRYKRTT